MKRTKYQWTASLGEATEPLTGFIYVAPGFNRDEVTRGAIGQIMLITQRHKIKFDPLNLTVAIKLCSDTESDPLVNF
jgi:hypothetical protein